MIRKKTRSKTSTVRRHKSESRTPYRVGVCILSTTWGGAETVVLQLLRQYERAGIAAVLFANSEILEQYTVLTTTTLVDLGSYSPRSAVARASRLAHIALRLRTSIGEHHIDIMHAHLEQTLFALGVGVYSLPIPVVFTCHGGESDHYKNPRTLEHRAVRHSMQTMFTQVPRFTVVSCAQWQVLQYDKKYRSAFTVIPNGVNRSVYRPRTSRLRKHVVLFAGRYAEQKGIKYLVAAAHMLPDVTFWCAGTGPLENLLHGDNMVNKGFQQPAQLAQLIQQATVCVFPSLYEAFPLVGLEAMACGRAIVATEKGFGEYVQHGQNGILIPARNSKALVSAIRMLLANPSQRRNIERAALATAKKYSWDHIATAYQHVYRKAIDKFPRKQRRYS